MLMGTLFIRLSLACMLPTLSLPVRPSEIYVVTQRLREVQPILGMLLDILETRFNMLTIPALFKLFHLVAPSVAPTTLALVLKPPILLHLPACAPKTTVRFG